MDHQIHQCQKYNENRIISHIIDEVQNEIRHESLLVGGAVHLPANGSMTQVSDASRSSNYAIRNETEELIVVTHDRLGNRVSRS